MVISGVPQGTALGPVIFLLNSNDIDSSINVRTKKLSDDPKFCSVEDNLEIMLH